MTRAIRLVVDDAVLDEDVAAVEAMDRMVAALSALPDVRLARVTRRQDRRGRTGHGVYRFPPHQVSHGAQDSRLLQELCDAVGADAFVSFGWSSPLRTPMILLLTERPLPMLWPPAERVRRHELEVGISFALGYVCVSQSIAEDLLALFPQTRARDIEVLEADGPQADGLAAAVLRRAFSVQSDAAAGYPARFLQQWERLRRLQELVDVS